MYKEDNRPALEKKCDYNPKALARLERAWKAAKKRPYPDSVELWWEWADNHGPLKQLEYQEFIMLSGIIQAQTRKAVPVIKPSCRKCGGNMRPGKAIGQTWSGSPDFAGGEVVTMSPGGPGKMIDCMKCANCGHSVT